MFDSEVADLSAVPVMRLRGIPRQISSLPSKSYRFCTRYETVFAFDVSKSIQFPLCFGFGFVAVLSVLSFNVRALRWADPPSRESYSVA